MTPRVFFVNLIGGLGYISCLLQWIWSLVFYLPTILDSHVLETFLPPKQPIPAPAAPVIGPPSPLLIGVAIAVTVLVGVATIYVLAKIPFAIAKAGKKVTHEAAELAVPIVTHHQQLPSKKRRILTARLVRVIKLLLIAIPFIAVLFIPRTSLPVAFDIIFLISAALALGSIIWFSLQLLVARLTRVPSEQLW